MSKTAPNFRPILTPLDVPDDALDRINDQLGVPTMVRSPQQSSKPPQNDAVDAARAPSSGSPSGKKKAAPRSKKLASASMASRGPVEKLTIELPGYLTDALKRDALDRRTTVRHVVMLGLQALGLQIEAADLVPDARRTRHKTARP